MVRSRRSRWKSRSTPNANGYSYFPRRSGYRCHKRCRIFSSLRLFPFSLGIASSTGIQHSAFSVAFSSALLQHHWDLVLYFWSLAWHPLHPPRYLFYPSIALLSLSLSVLLLLVLFTSLLLCCSIHFAWHRPAATSWRAPHHDDDDQ